MDVVRWFAVRVVPQHEAVAFEGLHSKGIEAFSPTYQSRRKWSDRTKVLELPLFPGYVFGRFAFAAERVPVLRTPGVRDVVRLGPRPTPVADEEIDAVRTLVRSGFRLTPCPFLSLGDRVRVERGALRGVEGILVSRRGRWELIVSVEVLHRSVSVVATIDDVVRIGAPRRSTPDAPSRLPAPF
jgi:transcription antitermination factor NusG